MKRLSTSAGLHMIYTNHSIRSTSITTWDESNIAARHICGVSGHKSEETIKCYSRKCPPKKKREMCDILSEKLNNPVPKKKKTDANFDTINMEDYDFDDWVPIENNKEDFDLQALIAKLEKVEKENAQGNVSGNTTSAGPLVPAQEITPSTNAAPLATPLNNQNQSNVVNFTQASNIPVVPKMFFPNSNVTINYNFGPKPNQ